MPENKQLQYSLKNSIMVAFFLLAIIWGIILSAVFQQVLSAMLTRYNWDEFAVREILSKVTLVNTSFTIAGSILVVFIALLFSKLIAVPVEKLLKGVKEVCAGNLDAKVDVQNYDEIGELAEAFNQMTENLNRMTVSRNALNKVYEELMLVNAELRQVQAQVVQGAKMAAVGQLAGGVAHEINNPLSGVLNNVQLIKMLAEEKKDFNIEEFRELLSVIEGSALRCKNITQALLDFSHVSSGAYQPVSLNTLTEQVLILVEHELKLQNLPIKKELAPDLPLISGDAQLLQQVIFNFISNASWAVEKRFHKEEGGVISIKTYSEKDKGLACISVSDNGIGIAKENIERMFEPFFTTKAVGEGTGLGLSVVYNIIKIHKGTISIESEVNKGTTFRVAFSVKQNLPAGD